MFTTALMDLLTFSMILSQNCSSTVSIDLTVTMTLRLSSPQMRQICLLTNPLRWSEPRRQKCTYSSHSSTADAANGQ